jgi:hypothetical protein
MNITGLTELKLYHKRLRDQTEQMRLTFIKISKNPPKKRTEFEGFMKYMDSEIKEQTDIITILKNLSESVRGELIKEPESTERLLLMLLLNEIDLMEPPKAFTETYQVIADKLIRIS